MTRMSTKTSARLGPVCWGIVIFLLAQALTFLTVVREDPFLERVHIYVPPQSAGGISLWPTPTPPPPVGETPAPQAGSLGPLLIFIFGFAIVLGIVLFTVPIRTLRLLLRIIFALLFTWGVFIVLIFWLPLWAVVGISAATGLTWFFVPRVWFHNLVMMLAMVSVGAVFGRLITPWTAMILIGVLAIYDFLAVRFGYMVWMTKKLSQSIALPAFVIPKRRAEWATSLRQPAVTELVDQDPLDRQYSILGGGDVGFSLLLTASVYFGYGPGAAGLVAGFSLAGLMIAYWIQAAFLKGKAMPALPPIAVMSLIALLIVRFV